MIGWNCVFMFMICGILLLKFGILELFKVFVFELCGLCFDMSIVCINF